ncbi:hypothetical protein KEM55_003597 [Ascosphaera atra]|nr:hypothetical protein KEM55_003597 [Ascosphaera atra]
MASIPVTYTYPQEDFKLVELSPELLELLSSGKTSRLYLKSPGLPAEDAPPVPIGSPAAEPFVNLCTEDKTYYLRQVSSSNSTLLVRPRPQRAEGTAEEKKDGKDAQSVSIIASCKGQLEVMKTPDWYTGVPFLTRALRVFDGDSDDVRMGDVEEPMPTQEEQAVAMKRLFNDIPVSAQECLRDWRSLCAFVDHANGDAAGGSDRVQCYRPSATAKLNVWTKAMEACVLSGIDPLKDIYASVLWNAILDGQAEPFPRLLFEAVLRRCAASVNPEAKVGSLEEHCQKLHSVRLDKPSTVVWTGLTLLEAKAPRMASAIDDHAFIAQWKDLVPEDWREDATLNKLKVCKKKQICASIDIDYAQGNYKMTVDGMRIYFQANMDKKAITKPKK